MKHAVGSVRVPQGCVAMLFEDSMHTSNHKQVFIAGNYTGSQLQALTHGRIAHGVSEIRVFDAGKCGLHAWFHPFRSAAMVSVCDEEVRGQVYAEPGFSGWCCEPSRNNCKVTHALLDGWWRKLVARVRSSVTTKAMRCGCAHGTANLVQCYDSVAATPGNICSRCDAGYTLQSNGTCTLASTGTERSAVANANQATTDARNAMDDATGSKTMAAPS